MKPSKARKPVKSKPATAKAKPATAKAKPAKAAKSKPAKAKPTKTAAKSAAIVKPAAAPLRLFGTDGIRAVAGRNELSPERVLALGRALGRHLRRIAEPGKRPMVLLGVDPRPSADLVGTSLAAGLVAESCDVHWPGMMSTPEIAFLTKHGPFLAGISVTASHNPATDNGIKLFGKDGRKLADDVEAALERAVLSGDASGDAVSDGTRFGWLQLGRDRHYEEFLVKTFRKSFATLAKKPLSVVVDCAFGARSIDLQTISRISRSVALGRTVPEFRVGAAMNTSPEAEQNALHVYFLNAASPSQPDTHHLINAGCGSMHPEACARAVREVKADLGICFDGDGDRCVLVDETGETRDGDYMLAILAADLKQRGTLKADTVVTTSMANLGLQEAMDELGVRLVRTDVGDKYVARAMVETGAVLGGEQSGHVIIADEGHFVGDGLYTALRIIEVMLDRGQPLSRLCAGLRKYPQVIVNVPVKCKPALEKLPSLGRARAEVEQRLGARGRINVRYSGTEPLLRIMVEAPDEASRDQAAAHLEQAARKDLG
ncbi:MAG: phosphoglucosamine mutase [Planctomycetes bacterium]|nr:phosphoglucosamine mutase [Planctomycetota bacterium]